MKRIFALLLALISVLLPACSTQPEVYIPTGNGLTWDDEVPGVTEPSSTDAAPEQELVLVYYPDRTMNPYTCTDFTNRALFSLIYQSLFVVDSNYNVSPMLCSRYTMSESMRTYEFYIEPATFSDGSLLTIEDVYASIQMAMSHPIYRGRFLHVRTVELNDAGGITFKLDTAYENFPILLDLPIVKASEVEAESPAQIRDAFEFENVGLVCVNPGSDAFADYRCDYEL